jgi:hypothetical protein
MPEIDSVALCKSPCWGFSYVFINQSAPYSKLLLKLEPVQLPFCYRRARRRQADNDNRIRSIYIVCL